jgi:hypothetical protein
MHVADPNHRRRSHSRPRLLYAMPTCHLRLSVYQSTGSRPPSAPCCPSLRCSTAILRHPSPIFRCQPSIATTKLDVQAPCAHPQRYSCPGPDTLIGLIDLIVVSPHRPLNGGLNGTELHCSSLPPASSASPASRHFGVLLSAAFLLLSTRPFHQPLLFTFS